MSFDETHVEAFSRPLHYDLVNGKQQLNSLRFIGSYWEIPSSLMDLTQLPSIVAESDLPRELLHVLAHGNSFGKHVFKTSDDGLNQLFVFEYYLNEYWSLWKPVCFALEELDCLPKLVTSDASKAVTRSSTHLSKWADLDISDLLHVWKEDRQLYIKEDSELMGDLDMKSCRKQSERSRQKKSSERDWSIVEPKIYLQKKYYETLFSLRIPLVYFVKSNLVRTKNLSQDLENTNHIAYQTHLTDLLLEVEDFDARHNSGIMEYDLNSETISGIRDNCLAKIGDLLTSGVSNTFKDISLAFKVRELKLQIVLLLELIALSCMDSQLDNFEEKYKFRMRKRAKRLASTKISSRSNSKWARKETKAQSLDYCEKLDVYLDKLCIIDTMLLIDASIQKSSPVKDDGVNSAAARVRELKKNMLNSGKETSSQGFITYVLIPHFMKKTPHAVDFISRKIKSPRFDHPIRVEKRNTSNLSAAANNHDYTNSYEPSSSPPSEVNAKESSVTSPLSPEHYQLNTHVYKRITLSQRPPTLNSRGSSHLSEALELESGSSKKYISATRGNSDLFLNKLQRRQLPATDLITDSGSTVSRSKSELVGMSEARPKQPLINRTSSTGVFQRVNKRKLDPRKTTLVSSNLNVQVQATPYGKNRSAVSLQVHNPTIIESPSINVEDYNSNIGPLASRPVSHIGTPSKFLPQDHMQVPASGAKATDNNYDVIDSSRSEKVKKVRRRLFAPE
ncbi:LANO_0F02058g1_1 [Lachancea nothofagi CBS 11611]|uniref:LANO_0F02058g1_1 n=1 Tax=Lachancea nothofagi CBS 11611 TaxID=1266666 RepID=A0A1G4K6R2_9SACH|nr:LANO_0F02058g1_1 [Lachancea nothofagi CBS 11611]